MASEVDICNLALGHLGDRATVASIDPPEGSAQAEHCARFYPISRDTLLEMHAWNFATKRVVLPQLGSGWPEWDYAYAKPNDAIVILAVTPPGVTDDYSAIGSTMASAYTPQPYSVEVDADGADVIYSDTAEAVARYIARVTDTTRFSPLFVEALTWHLAAKLAGPVLKGDAGAAEAKRCMQMADYWIAKAKVSDANQRMVRPTHTPSWIGAR